MGDNHRFEIVADFIARNFKPCKVADVAGGNGDLSTLLNQKGFDCTVVDPRSHKALNSNRLQPKRIRGLFRQEMAAGFDLLIGLHPDEATEEICKAAWRYRKPAFIVPCCNHWNERERQGKDLPTLIKQFFESHRVPFHYAYLKMKGMNVAFVVNKG